MPGQMDKLGLLSLLLGEGWGPPLAHAGRSDERAGWWEGRQLVVVGNLDVPSPSPSTHAETHTQSDLRDSLTSACLTLGVGKVKRHTPVPMGLTPLCVPSHVVCFEVNIWSSVAAGLHARARSPLSQDLDGGRFFYSRGLGLPRVPRVGEAWEEEA